MSNDLPEILNASGDKLRLFAVWCARRVQHLIRDNRSLNALKTAERYAIGKASKEELVDAFKKAVEVEPEGWRKFRVDIAARQTAYLSSLEAAYFASLGSAHAIADDAADSKYQPQKWNSIALKEFEIQKAMLQKILATHMDDSQMDELQQKSHFALKG